MIDLSHNKYLFTEIKKGNQQVFELLYKSYYFRLRGYAAKFIHDTEIIDDLIQECFLILWEKRDNLKPVSISSLLFTMIRNSCLNHLKHLTITQEHMREEYEFRKIEEKLYYLDFGIDPSHKLLYDELNEQISLITNNLPPRCKEVFILSRHEGLKNKEIAEKLEISTTAVEKHIKKALSIFTRYFTTNYPVDITYFLLLTLTILQ